MMMIIFLHFPEKLITENIHASKYFHLLIFGTPLLKLFRGEKSVNLIPHLLKHAILNFFSHEKYSNLIPHPETYCIKFIPFLF